MSSERPKKDGRLYKDHRPVYVEEGVGTLRLSSARQPQWNDRSTGIQWIYEQKSILPGVRTLVNL